MDSRTRVDVDDEAKQELDDAVDDLRGTKKEIASEALVKGINEMLVEESSDNEAEA